MASSRGRDYADTNDKLYDVSPVLDRARCFVDGEGIMNVGSGFVVLIRNKYTNNYKNQHTHAQ